MTPSRENTTTEPDARSGPVDVRVRREISSLTPPVPEPQAMPIGETSAPAGPVTPVHLDLTRSGGNGDGIFRGLSLGAGVIVIAMVAFIAFFLLWRAIPSLQADASNFITSRDWLPSANPPRFGIAGLLYTTVLLSAFAMLIAVPISIGLALFITQYAPRKLASTMGYLVDLLAAVPSIIFGLWGLSVLAPKLLPVAQWVTGHLGTWKATSWFPLTKPAISDGGTIFTAGVVVAIMILPIVTSISREVYRQTPVEHRDGALALGATRWEMIRLTVIPYGRSAVVSGAMLGLGRALGETIAVLIILSQPFNGSGFNPSLFNGGETFASKIANNAAEFNSPTQTGAYIAAGLVLFVVTFAVNFVARAVVRRGNRGAA
jgi:phosphate transport system permease protein